MHADIHWQPGFIRSRRAAQLWEDTKGLTVRATHVFKSNAVKGVLRSFRGGGGGVGLEIVDLGPLPGTTRHRGNFGKAPAEALFLASGSHLRKCRGTGLELFAAPHEQHY